MRARHEAQFLLTFLFVACLLGTAAHAQSDTFYVAEQISQSGSCVTNTAKAVTAQMVQYLRDHGWTGVWYTGASAWPQDLVEDSFGGLDSTYGDSKNLSVLQTHGWTDARRGFAYMIPHNGKCNLDVDAEVRLGERVSFGGNGRASYFMGISCCTMYVPKLREVWVNSGATVGLAQAMGFHGETAMNSDEPRMIVAALHDNPSTSNRTQWLDIGSHCGPWYWFCANSPVVLSLGKSLSQAYSIHYYSNIWYRYTDPYIEKPMAYYYSYVDNGHGACF